MLEGKPQPVPWPPDSLPHSDLINHPEEIAGLVEKNGAEVAAKDTATPATDAAAPAPEPTEGETPTPEAPDPLDPPDIADTPLP
jgi:hypothetical protein